MATDQEIEIAAVLELNLLNWEGLLPGFNKAKIFGNGEVPANDISGSLIFKRLYLQKGTKRIGFFDIANKPGLGTVLLHVAEIEGTPHTADPVPLELRSPEELWELLQQAQFSSELGGQYSKWKPIGLYVYALPKMALAVRDPEGELHYFDLGGWNQIPPLLFKEGKSNMFGYTEALSGAEGGWENPENVGAFQARVSFWNEIAETMDVTYLLNHIDRDSFEPIRKQLSICTSCIRIGPGPVAVTECLPPKVSLLGQANGMWCVPASVRMALSVFSEATILGEEEIAQSLGLYYNNSPRTLPPGEVGRVDSFIDSQPVLEAYTDSDPKWPNFEKALLAGTPIISLIRGHCRFVGGTSRLVIKSGSKSIAMEGLSVLDPWPVDTGRRILWESFEPYTHEDNVVVVRV